MKRKSIALASLIFAATLTAFAQAQNSSPVPASAQDTGRPQLQDRFRYQLQRSDTFTIQFPLVPEYNQTVTVQPDGYIFLQDVGQVMVLGKTVSDVTDMVRIAYSKILHDPIVLINLTDFQHPWFTALGEVQKPGKYELREDITVTEAIAVAGGLTHDAKHSNVMLFHHTDNGIEVHKVDVKHMLGGQQSMTEDIHIQPGDIVWIPTSFNSKTVYKVRPWLPYYGFSVAGLAF